MATWVDQQDNWISVIPGVPILLSTEIGCLTCSLCGCHLFCATVDARESRAEYAFKHVNNKHKNLLPQDPNKPDKTIGPATFVEKAHNLLIEHRKDQTMVGPYEWLNPHTQAQMYPASIPFIEFYRSFGELNASPDGNGSIVLSTLPRLVPLKVSHTQHYCQTCNSAFGSPRAADRHKKKYEDHIVVSDETNVYIQRYKGTTNSTIARVHSPHVSNASVLVNANRDPGTR